ncbi:MAG TPA: methionine synthase [Cyanobacteria bacterium UBA11149]|nr:methionine synthase [Cyanobacteria bacterium UBA11367]HBE57775.1 methionine synthase [Cyanobacteria bacterium UBA11366]HBK62988.1 methionine synthase [Cyanobacteria bacterium UBA11166]HBR77254.1 methionine synthase [Cyanobacteria bacterium UBA11159]HBS69367.1 methionine synthase [Cyanobacteria bacterium UBA11153]HBW90112.1 methionine synthase [Cyanobacteria bacterium UBA11149]HCA97859.1 methionine synthase [Cyanobacteria bacterium UBA9226]
MPFRGIYTLANDVVYDQLVALLNSIEVNVSPDIPVCVIPYNDKLDKVNQEIAIRPNVTLFDNWESLEKWDEFVNQVWEAHPRASESSLSRPGWYKGYVHRKFAAFHGDFETFVFYDADSLAMKPIDDIFEKIKDYDFVFNDWEHAKPREVTQVDLSKIEQATNLTEADIRRKLHCDSFIGSKKGIFNSEVLGMLKERLIQGKEVEWVRPTAWWSSSALFTYLTFPLNRPIFNFTLSPNGQDRTGNCADADPFVNIDNVLYNEEGLKPIHRIHYMNYPAIDFTRLCQGEDVNIRYQDIFLHYRFLKEPNLKPMELKKPTTLTQMNRKFQKAVAKIKRTIS